MIDELVQFELIDERDAARFARRGHFAYEAGHHGDTLLSLEVLFTDPERHRRAAARLVQRLMLRAGPKSRAAQSRSSASAIDLGAPRCADRSASVA